MSASISAVSASQTGRTVTFTYTAPAGDISNGSVTVTVPSGWNAPSTTGANAGYSTASAGTLTVSGQTITVSSLTLAAGNTFTITYGSTASGGPGATATSTTGAQTWTTQEKSTVERVAREPLFLPQHHRVRGGRCRHDVDVDQPGLGEPDRAHDHVHVHGPGGRHLQRRRHRHGAERLERTLHDRCERRLLQPRAPAPSPSPARPSPSPH